MIHPLRKRIVFVDELVERGWRLGPNTHMLPEDESPEALAALHETAVRIGLRRAWFQDGKWPHYDLNRSRTDAARRLPNVVSLGCTAYVRMRLIMRRGAFVEPGTGLTMKLNEWYVISDSGSSYSPVGYPDAREAARAALAFPDYLLKAEDLSPWVPENPSKGLTDPRGANIVRGQDMLVFWASNDYESLLQTEIRHRGEAT